MFKKLLVTYLLVTVSYVFSVAQPITVFNIATTGKLTECNMGLPTVTATFLSGNGTTVSGGVLTCTDPCDTTYVEITMSNLRWNKGPDINWIHGVFFPANAGFTFLQTSLPPTSWINTTGCTGINATNPGSCGSNAGTVGAPGFYFRSPSPGCCPGGGATQNPCDNWGDPGPACSSPLSFTFQARICNDRVIGSAYTLKVKATADGNTGCWSQADVGNNNTLTFSLATSACGPQFAPVPTPTSVVRNCSGGTPNYTATFTGGCGNGSGQVNWYSAAVGGTLVGTSVGNTFVYDPPGSACPAGTLYASCCPAGSTCINRRAVSAGGFCTAILIDSVFQTNPSCTSPNASIDSVRTLNAGGPITYTLNPGGFTNTTGIFPGLTGTNYTLTATDGTGCSSTKSVTFTPGSTGGPAPTVTTPVNYCQNATATPLTATGTNLLWYTGATGGTGSPTAPTPSTTTPGSTIYYVSQTVGGCESPRALITVNVTGVVTMTLSSPAPTANQTLCINSPLTNIIYSTTGNPAGVNATGLPAGVTGSYNAGTGIFTISGTPTVAGTFNYVVTTTGGCSSATQSGTITVSPIVTITLTSAAATTSQVICINTALTNITYNIGGGATGATVTALPAGITGTYSAGVFTISGTPTVAGTFPYTVTTTGGCGSATSSGTITVNPAATLTLTSPAATANQTVCVNNAITNITYSTGGSATGATVTGLPGGVTGTFPGGVFTISGTPTATGVFNYTVTTTGGCGIATLSGIITVSTAATLTLSSAASTTAQTICINTALTNISYNVGGGATSATAAGLPAGVTGTFSAGVFTISGTPTVSGPFSYTVTTVGGCGTVALSGTITVTPGATLTLTSAAATTTQTVCVNTALTNITYSTGGSATGATVTGLPGGVTGTFASGVFTISGTPTATGTFNYTVSTTGGCGTATLSGIITVSTAATLSLSSPAATTAQTICINTALTNISYNVGGGATGATVTGLPAGVTGTFSGGVFTISGTPTVSGLFSYTVTTVGGCGTITLSGTITATPDATITLTSAASTTTQTICVNTPLTNITYTIGGSATGATVTGLPAGVTGTFSGSVFTISGTPTATGTFPYTVTTTGGCGTAILSGVITVNSNVTLVLTSAPGTTNQTVSINTPITTITYTAGGGATGVTVTGLPAGVTGIFSGGVFTISGTPTVSGTFIYSVTTTGGCGSVTLTGTIIVNDQVTITLTSAPGSNNQTICITNPIVNITYSVGGGATGASITAGALPPGVTGTYSAGVFTISGTPTVTGTFNYTISATGGVGTASLSGTIIVNPAATIALTSAAATTSQTVWVNTSITNITYSTGNGSTGAAVTGLPAGVTGTYSGGVFTISGTPTVAGTFNYTVTT